jgi:hypothetical protein
MEQTQVRRVLLVRQTLAVAVVAAVKMLRFGLVVMAVKAL